MYDFAGAGAKIFFDLALDNVREMVYNTLVNNKEELFRPHLELSSEKVNKGY